MNSLDVTAPLGSEVPAAAPRPLATSRPVHRHSLENFRALAILCVMVCHLESIRDFGEAGRLFLFVFGGGTTLFIFISGYLFHHTEHARFDHTAYLGRKLRHVICPYLVLSVPVITAGLLESRAEAFDLSAPAYVLWSLLVGGSLVKTLWFIPMISVIFVMTPLFHRLAQGAWLLPVVLAALVFSLSSGRPVGSLNPFLGAAHYLGFYLLGIAASVHAGRIARLAEGRWFWALVLGGAGVLSGALALDLARDPGPMGFGDALGTLNTVQSGKLGLLVAAFLLIHRFLDRPSAALSHLADISFGLYFLHGILAAGHGRLLRGTAWHPLLALAVEAAVVIGVSVVLVHLVRRQFGRRSRYVVGC
ncbi:acyltransferase family protein [Piscinibacter gummiphilus]|uniref:Uncharacterized protein n=1 Tax=Piscinibacter gummiphilus TaxID=946333 RepID=A0A1W6L8A1_9BURK|nr:acyltransferase [Piscinibacter gummiphilus]ARN20400.1 hypothetical protein A4W93_11100 [Piscinibacter gummiphilus]GLS98538.1 hypothetical protein GCM10007918_58300 [Piscinibacter gummiphilus]